MATGVSATGELRLGGEEVMRASYASHVCDHAQVPPRCAKVMNTLVSAASLRRINFSLVVCLVSLMYVFPAASPAGAQLVSFSPTSSLNYGNVAVANSALLKVTLTNTGITNLVISSIVPTGNYSQTNNCGSPILPNKQCTIAITFTPATTGTRTGSVTITDNAPNSPHIVGLTGGGALQAQGTLSATSLVFGNQGLGTQSAYKALTLTNNLSVALSINSVFATGDFAQTNNCGTTLQAKGICTIYVIFNPTLLGTETGTLTISDSAPNTPQTATLT